MMYASMSLQRQPAASQQRAGRQAQYSSGQRREQLRQRTSGAAVTRTLARIPLSQAQPPQRLRT